MLPLNDFIFSNPDWANMPIRIVLGVVFLMLFLLSLRYGPNGAKEALSRFRWIILAAFAAAALWGMYAYSVLHPSSGWIR